MTASRLRHRDDAVFLEDAPHLAQQPFLVWNVMERVIEHDAIDRGVRDRQRLTVIGQERRIERPVGLWIPLEQRAADGERRG